MAASPPPPPPPQLFSVDADGNGAGRIVSETGDVYEGGFVRWQRHGWGVQRWASSGAVYRGGWEEDKQACGVFTDASGVKWKGDFRTGAVERVTEESPRHQQAGEEKEERPATAAAVTHFPVTSLPSPYQSQYEHETAPSSARHDFSSTQLGATQPLPPHSARSSRSTHGRRIVQGAPRPVAFTRRRESKAQREEREAREAQEEAIVLRELRLAAPLLCNRFGNGRLPGSATFGLDADSPGPAAYAPSLTQTRRVAPSTTMAPRLPFQSEVALMVKTSASKSGPWGASVQANNPSKPTIPAVSMSRPTMLPTYVKESSFFKDCVPGPGSYDTALSAKGGALDLARNTGPVADHGGSQIKGHPIPRFTGHAFARTEGLGRGADLGLYSPRIESQSGRERAPSYSMGARSKMHIYTAMKTAPWPGPGAHSPSFARVHVDPLSQTTAWGNSRAGARPCPTESIRAVPYTHPGQLRAQLGLASPGPAAYNITPTALPTAPANPRATSFGPHLVQPPAVRVAASFVSEGHPFVAKFKAQQQPANDDDEQPEEDEQPAE